MAKNGSFRAAVKPRRSGEAVCLAIVARFSLGRWDITDWLQQQVNACGLS